MTRRTSEEKRKKVLALLSEDVTLKDISLRLGIGLGTVHRIQVAAHRLRVGPRRSFADQATGVDTGKAK